ncbi:MAG: glycerol-3-phosphate dehydrogenase [Desulforhopalus sp.]|jgi:glycerol-3-phosphate dehydrogenase
MKRNIKKLADNTFDIVVVGAGIHGATIALEAAKAGFSVALLEKGDFGSSTSANSLKIVHGGIRYLQHGDFKRMRESITSRRSMMQFAPHLVKPLACLMPTYGHGIKGHEMMRLAFGIYDFVALDKNVGLSVDNSLSLGKSIDKTEVKWAVPGVSEEGLTGGAVWYDALAENTERLTLEYVKEAVRYGAVAVNYTEVVDIESGSGQVKAVVAQDKLKGGGQIRISCDRVINAAGPWVGALVGDNSSLGSQQWASAVNIVVKKRLFKKYAVGLEGYTDFVDKDALIKRGKRLFFFVPWLEKYTMVGTTYKPYHGKAEDLDLSKRELLQGFLDDINKVYPAGELTLGDVTFCHAGLVPMNESDDSEQDSVQLDKSSQIIDHSRTEQIDGFYSIKGVKYTTAPVIAQDMVNIICKKDGREKRTSGSYVSAEPLNVDHGPMIQQLGDEFKVIKQHLKKTYGSDWRSVIKYLVYKGDSVPNAPLWLSLDPQMLEAEVMYFIHDEMAFTLSDVILRRSNIGAAEEPEEKVLAAIADVMAKELGWSEDDKHEQISRVKQFFTPLSE